MAGTTAAPFNVAPCFYLIFSTDGGLTFPFTLVASTANDGTENIVIPAQATTKFQLMVKSIDNIFFDINTANITITSACTAEGAVVAPANTVLALAGARHCDAGLSPQYSTPLTIAGTPQAIVSGASLIPGSMPEHNKALTVLAGAILLPLCCTCISKEKQLPIHHYPALLFFHAEVTIFSVPSCRIWQQR